MLTEHNTIPSFLSGGKNDITKELSYKDGKYSITLTDKNGVLSDYSFTSSDANVTVSKSENKLTITTEKAVSGSVRITATRNNVPTVSSSAKLIAYGDPDLQDLVTGVENADSVKGYINVETPTGTIALKKTSEDGVVEGISFHIKGNGVDKTVKTDKNGNITVEGLFPATYTITEQSIDRYEPQQTQTVTLIGGKTTTVNFNNTLKRGSLEVIKTSEDNLVESVTFHLYGTSLSGLTVDEYAVTDKNGVAKFENVLISGNTPYVLEEVDTAIRYVVPENQTAPIEWNKVTNRSFTNILKKFNVTVTKADAETGTAQGDATLAGAVYGIYKGEERIDTYTTDKNGQFTTKYYICDNDWAIREISPSEGYLLDSTTHKVGAEAELYTVEYNTAVNDVNEQVIKGNIAIIKHTDNGDTQIETPEEGAVFEVFLKSAGSYENAKETERDILTCDENGKTYIIENEAGKGFTNEAQKGSLKIVKTSSDGKLEGFSFRVTGINYDKTFKTDKNGEIFIEGLRIGEYTVSEVSDNVSAGYILPADKQATVQVGATTIVQMHNELRDTPKTGDDFNPALWGGLAAACVLGAGVLGVVAFRKKKKED